MRQWLTTADGGLDRANLMTLTAVFLALAGGLALIGGSLYQVAVERNVNTSALLYMAGVCVAPLTGGVVATGLKGRADSKTAAAIQAGELPGRRATDTTESPTP